MADNNIRSLELNNRNTEIENTDLVRAMMYDQFMGILPLRNINGLQDIVRIEGSLSEATARAYNSETDASRSTIDKRTFSLTPFGKKIQADYHYLEADPGAINDQITLGMSALMKDMTKAFFKGYPEDTHTLVQGIYDINEKDNVGLLENKVLIEAGGSDAGLSVTNSTNRKTLLENVTKAIAYCDTSTTGQKVIVVGREMKLLLDSIPIQESTQFQMNPGQVSIFERIVPTMFGLPVIIVGQDSGRNDILGFDEETADESKSDAGSIWVLNLDSIQGVCMAVGGDMNFKEVDDDYFRKYIIDPRIAPEIRQPENAVRIRGIRRTS